MTDRPPTALQENILEAMRVANPDIAGDLARKLNERGVSLPATPMPPSQENHERRSATRRGRSRFVSGWTP